MKNLKLVIALVVTLFLGSSFIVHQEQPRQLKQQKFTPYLFGTFDLEVDSGLLMPIKVYGEQIYGDFIVTGVEHAIRGYQYTWTGDVIVVNGVITADLDVTIPSGTFHYYGPFD
jgi:hypothetical protein